MIVSYQLPSSSCILSGSTSMIYTMAELTIMPIFGHVVACIQKVAVSLYDRGNGDRNVISETWF
jgi:hypothetical protein